MSDSQEEETNAPPLKKARYHWQVKSSKLRQETVSSNSAQNEGGSENNNLHPNGVISPEYNQNQTEVNRSFENGVKLETESEEDISNDESTESKILDTLKKIVSGQTSKIVLENAISQCTNSNNANLADNSITDCSSISSPLQNHSENAIAGPSRETNDDALISGPNGSDFEIDPDTESRPPPALDYITRWQSQQKAKAIVDNAINMTLEEMGLTPDLDHNLPILDRLHVEDESISEAIRRRGLYRPDNEDIDAIQGNITPLIQQLTQVSDRVFEDRLNNMRLFITIRQTARNPTDGSETPIEWTDELAIRTLQSNSSEVDATANQSNDPPIPNQAFQLTLNPPLDPEGTNQNDSTLSDDESDFENYYLQSDSLSESVTGEPSSSLGDNSCEVNRQQENTLNINTANNNDINAAPHSDITVTSDRTSLLTDHSQPETFAGAEEQSANDSDLMNFAVNAAISAKGLTVQK